MEKVIYLLWRDPRVSRGEFDQRLRGEFAPRLLELGALGVQLNVSDEAVSAAAPTLSATRPQMEAFVSLWLHTANAEPRKPFDDVVAQAASRFAAYLVTESQPLVNTLHPGAPGRRTTGFAQVALFARPPRLARAQWLELWLAQHTQLAIDTQSSFYYVQNVVARTLTFDAPAFDAIVEEGFPQEAFGSQAGFYGAVDDKEKLRRHRAAMYESTQRFIDADRLDVVQTSQWVVKAPR